MNIILTNDDGVYAEGINTLYKELKKHHRVLLVAPDREQSASSHSLTLSRPLRMRKFGVDYYSCDGTPTDSIMMAILNIMKNKRPDLVVSGINHGANMGEDIIYSGTVAAAIEGSQFDIPSLAVSMVNSEGADFKGAARFIRRFIKLYPELNVDSKTIFNINIPGKIKDGFKKYRYTFLGSRKYDDVIIEKTDPRGNDYYWIAGKPLWKKQAGSDINAINAGEVSITPLRLNFTDGDVLNNLLSDNVKLPR